MSAATEIKAKVLTIRDIANVALARGELAGPRHRDIFEATGKILDAVGYPQQTTT